MKIKPRYIAAIMVFMALTALVVLTRTESANAKAASNQKIAELLGTLKGFEPGAKVTYQIFPQEGRTASGEAMTDAQGNLKLPAYNMYDAAGDHLSYNLQIKEQKNQEPLNIIVNFDASTGKILVDGKGLQEFSEVGIENSGIIKMTRADWAGLLKNSEGGSLRGIEKENGLKLAFYDSGVMNDASKSENPKIIEVLAAPGGGELNPSRLNQYQTSYGCYTQDVNDHQFSFCNTQAMDQQIKNVVDNYVMAMIMMSHQFVTVMAQQVAAVGKFMDAKIQLEAQREFQQRVAEAHKDYHPSELMCEFGSFVKSITTAEEKAQYEKLALNDILLNFYADLKHTSGQEGFSSDVESRIQQFRKVYCDVKDNNNGLNFICDHDQLPGGIPGGTDPVRFNKDIEYARTLGDPLTLDLDLSYAQTPGITTREQTKDEEDVIALAKNLYWPKVLPPGNPKQIKDNFEKYFNERKLFAMTNIAHNSFITIAGLKSKTGPSRDALTGAVMNSGGNYMQAMMRNFDLTDEEITQTLGEYPSYYAQMEVLTKKMYQDPDFYTNLYDKPTNVKRISATMEAIGIMQARDAYESALRREMLTSMMVEAALVKHVDRLNGAAISETKNLRRR